ncbi:MAG: flagellar basal body-associated FliL family protein [Betaproteobacteria bacterium]
MAKEPEATAPAAAGKKKKPILIIAIVAVVLILGGGGAAFYFLAGKKPKDGEHHEEAAEHAKAPVFVTLEPFTVNLASEASDRYLQVGIDLKVSAEEVSEKVKAHLPEIRNGILLLLTSKQVEQIAGVQGKNELRVEIRDIVNKSIGYLHATEAPKPSIEKVDEHAAETGEKPVEAPEEKPVEKPASKPPKDGVLDVLLTSFVIQ